mmetsp:Transcript_51140/g.95274  ORF Transcript_51140/g.95274 Transcript_51140/m.95274 type:complete len:428 (-) Transcript_51140:176-1459(-)|eukprot:CAMPEP_0114302776 /NCGR_PEP_ID=MMETSP0059-20121206/14848_1 /TAXON_ID=36894 /ORGANISM="Pyramimonas parkeae, Strain CCMP726" /LENGTH=427 /DNA_ID=CAMNT_0001425659 /DNA_START=236 /DNA_END=1519 /DNA_ORIENTATION=+
MAAPSKVVLDLAASSKHTDWKYVAEGAYNIVLRYNGPERLLDSFGLRCRKKKRGDSGTAGGDTFVPWDVEAGYVEKVFLPLLGRRYLLPNNGGYPMAVREGFLLGLGQHVDAHRPVRRRDNSIDDTLKEATLIFNNLVLHAAEAKLGAAHPTICVEIKPKWGFVPTSKSISHAVKLKHNRFTMHQQLKAKKARDKGHHWEISCYDPMKLFSYDRLQVKETLEDLIKVPQNNLRIFINQELRVDDNHPGLSALQAALQEACADHAAEFLLEALTEILTREPLLNRLRTAQMLDDMDIEAVFPAYQQILERGEAFDARQGETLEPREAPDSEPGDAPGQHELVRRFLVAATAKDCSMMITLRRCDGPAEPCSTNPDMPVDSGTHTHPVIRDLEGWEYSIMVVDLDSKPIEKIPYYFQQDLEIAESFAKT